MSNTAVTDVVKYKLLTRLIILEKNILLSSKKARFRGTKCLSLGWNKTFPRGFRPRLDKLVKIKHTKRMKRTTKV